jgi:amidase
MMTLEEYTSYDGLGLAKLVAQKDVTAQELADIALSAVKKVNPTINAVLQTLPEEAKSTIAEGVPRGAFTGVPFLIKEIVIHAKGVKCESGCALSKDMTPTADTELMARFRRAGLVLAGTTQTPELGYSPTTEARLYGPVHNPWDTSRSAGGSSGGSSAAVAAGVVPIAHANDGGGSIRIPASCNGLVGLKPSRFRIPSGPDYGAELLFGLAIEFAVTRSVRDAAALLDAVAGSDIGAPGLPLPPAQSYSDSINTAPRALKIAWTTQTPSGASSDPDCQLAVHETVRLLEELGHTLVEDAPRYEWEPFLGSMHILFLSFIAASVHGIAAATGRVPGPDNLEAVTLASYEEGKRYTVVDLLGALALQNTVSRQVGAFFETVDLLLTPTTAQIARPLGELNQNRAGMTPTEWTHQVFSFGPFTPVFNTTGQPAISVPLHFTKSGVPVGVQFAGRMGDEATLLQLAAQLEQARPWKSRRPKVHVASGSV